MFFNTRRKILSLPGHVISSICCSSKLNTKLEVISRYHEVVRSHFVARLKCRSQVRLQVTGHRSGHRSDHRSHKNNRTLFKIVLDDILYKNKTSQGASNYIFFCSELYQIPHMRKHIHVDHARRTCVTA